MMNSGDGMFTLHSKENHVLVLEYFRFTKPRNLKVFDQHRDRS